MVKKSTFFILIIFIIGLAIRLLIATSDFSYNNDVLNAFKIVKVFNEGKNVFLSAGQYQYGYNNTPVIFYIIGILYKVGAYFSVDIPLMINIILTFFDFFTAVVLLYLAKIKKLSSIKTVALYFLNPISIIHSSSGAQYENAAAFFIVLALLIYEQKKIKSYVKAISVWIVLTIGFLVEHDIALAVLTFALHYFKPIWKAILTFVGIFVVFLLSFFVYSPANFLFSIKSVLSYGGIPGFYGITSLLLFFYDILFKPNQICLNCFSPILGTKISNVYVVITYLFISSYLFFTLLTRYKDLGKLLLLNFLFFISFTTGIGAYFVLPVALGSLYPSHWFYIYTFSVTLFYLGSKDFLGITIFNWVPWNIVWIPALLWFFSEFKKVFGLKKFSP